MLPADRDLSKLDPRFLKRVKPFLAECPEIFITEAWRGADRQKQLVATGASKVAHSLHQDGLAIDIGFVGSELYPKDMAKWRRVADIAKKYGIDWGYDLWKWDKPHFQFNSSFIMDTLTSIIITLKELWSKQTDADKPKVGEAANKLRELQKALGLEVTK